jgi:putative transposase
MVTSETWGRRSLFRAAPWAKLFINTIYHYRDPGCQLHAFVVMPDHFHLLITPKAALERAVQYIKGGFSHRAKVELGSNMEVWQKGFSDHRVRDAADLDRHLNYIHSNPVRAGLCSRPDEYEYSSAHSGFALDEVPQRLKPQTQSTACDAAEAAPLQNSIESTDENIAAIEEWKRR